MTLSEDEPWEQRKHERYRIDLPARWTGESAVGFGVVKDIGPGGCFVRTEGAARTGEVVTLEVAKRGGERLSFLGHVLYLIEGEGFGVCFLPYGDAGNSKKVALLVKDSTDSGGR
ncbi:MAG: PilZ domain-containing protein [Pyrinomonadaceae bacterium]